MPKRHFVALKRPQIKKLLPQTQTKIKFGTKYQILGFSVSKSFFGSLRNLLSTLLTVVYSAKGLPLSNEWTGETAVRLTVSWSDTYASPRGCTNRRPLYKL